MYAIKVTPNYYEGTINAPSDDYLREDNTGITFSRMGWVATYPTEEAAQAVVDNLNSGVYRLDHGEAGRPGYEIVPAP